MTKKKKKSKSKITKLEIKRDYLPIIGVSIALAGLLYKMYKDRTSLDLPTPREAAGGLGLEAGGAYTQTPGYGTAPFGWTGYTDWPPDYGGYGGLGGGIPIGMIPEDWLPTGEEELFYELEEIPAEIPSGYEVSPEYTTITPGTTDLMEILQEGAIWGAGLGIGSYGISKLPSIWGTIKRTGLKKLTARGISAKLKGIGAKIGSKLHLPHLGSKGAALHGGKLVSKLGGAGLIGATIGYEFAETVHGMGLTAEDLKRRKEQYYGLKEVPGWKKILATPFLESAEWSARIGEHFGFSYIPEKRKPIDIDVTISPRTEITPSRGLRVTRITQPSISRFAPTTPTPLKPARQEFRPGFVPSFGVAEFGAITGYGRSPAGQYRVVRQGGQTMHVYSGFPSLRQQQQILRERQSALRKGTGSQSFGASASRAIHGG